MPIDRQHAQLAVEAGEIRSHRYSGCLPRLSLPAVPFNFMRRDADSFPNARSASRTSFVELGRRARVGSSHARSRSYTSSCLTAYGLGGPAMHSFPPPAHLRPSL